ncbi:MAG: efflux RND transporter periplasmic adaptor subunit [Gammaproteobacteria bacterium]|nr:efflux RND transporter periplasmic adaptor subunit [Gammaproteobacteria bacterium]MDE0366165.1 efflux RND transporter periplasmic adaptor subunit [Gammaproteobacteria bacterium]
MNGRFGLPALLLTILAACGGTPSETREPAARMPDRERGPNNGRMLRDGGFAIELAIYELGVAPEFRAWAASDGRRLDPRAVNLSVTLTRLGNRIDVHEFQVQDDFLRGASPVCEPHSFTVTVDARHNRRAYRWEYDSFEGRTRIGPEMAKAFGLETAVAGPAVIEETATLYGRVVPDPERVRAVSARFEGAIRSVHVLPGETVSEGELLARVESNESLQSYPIVAPIAGTVTERIANPGEQTAGRRLFTIVDASSVWAELAVFPGERDRIRPGVEVKITPASGGATQDSAISYIAPFSAANQSVPARAVLDNENGSLAPGTFVTAEARVAEHRVALAVRRSALQTFRDFRVVYAQFGDEYEVRMLDLGRSSGDWVEVLGGLEPGTTYVTANSYVLKADIEKSGAAHDH